MFGHGLGGEVLPPVTIGDREATLSIDVSPSTFDPKNPENGRWWERSNRKSQLGVQT